MNIRPNISAQPLQLLAFRSLTVNSTAQAVKADAGNIYAVNIVNRDTAAIYVKFYEKAAASVNPASDTPKYTLMVSASKSLGLRGWDIPFTFKTGSAISVRCVAGAADTDTTAPGTLPIIELDYA